MVARQSLPLPRIMPALDVVKNIRSRLGSGPVLPRFTRSRLREATETFRCCVVGTTAHSAHAAADVVRRQGVLVPLRCNLAAAIGVQDDRSAARPLPHGH
jgi:hypothetical protein